MGRRYPVVAERMRNEYQKKQLPQIPKLLFIRGRVGDQVTESDRPSWVLGGDNYDPSIEQLRGSTQ